MQSEPGVPRKPVRTPVPEISDPTPPPQEPELSPAEIEVRPLGLGDIFQDGHFEVTEEEVSERANY
jgi:hypothetical protein